MKKLLCFLGGALLLLNAQAQKISIEPFFIGDRVPDLPLSRIVNYKDSTVELSSLGEKLVILDFWNIHCSLCIEQFPKEDSLQKKFKDKIQFVLVTADQKGQVNKFFKRWDSIHHTKFTIPIVCGDSTLFYLFRHNGIPHYAWLTPNGRLIAQTGFEQINSTSIVPVAEQILNRQKDMHKSGFSSQLLYYEKPSSNLQQFIKKNNFPTDLIKTH